MKRTLVAAIAAVCLLLALPCPAQTGSVGVTGNYLQDAAGNVISNATICFAPTNTIGTPLAFRVNGNHGQAMSIPVCAQVTNGAFTLDLADTNLTTPQNVCFAVTVTDNNSGNVLLGGPGSGYQCVQPAWTTTLPNAWCFNGTCNFDNYPPTSTAQGLVTTGPQGPQGPAGCVVGQTCTGVMLLSGGAMTGAITSNSNITTSAQMLAQIMGAIYQVSSFAGADASYKWIACNNAVIAAGGGTCDARGLWGTQTFSQPVAVGNASGVPVTFLLPHWATWNLTMNDTSQCAFTLYPNTNTEGTNASTGGADMRPQTNSAMQSVVCTYNNGSTGSYLKANGFNIFIDPAPPYTITNAGLEEVGLVDGSRFDNITIWAQGWAGKLQWVHGDCCSLTHYNMIVNCNSTASCNPLIVGNGSESTHDVFFYASSYTHPGAAQHAVEIDGVANNIDFSNIYMEENLTSPQTASLVGFGAGSTSFGDHFSGLKEGQVGVAGAGEYTLDIPAGVTGVLAQDIMCKHGPCIDDEQNGVIMRTSGIAANFPYYAQSATAYSTGTDFHFRAAPSFDGTSPNGVASSSANVQGAFNVNCAWWNSTTSASVPCTWQTTIAQNASGTPTGQYLETNILGTLPPGTVPTWQISNNLATPPIDGSNNQQGYVFRFHSQYGNGSAVLGDVYTYQHQISSGTNPYSTFYFDHSGALGGYFSFPAMIDRDPQVTNNPTSPICANGAHGSFTTSGCTTSGGGGGGGSSIANVAVTIPSIAIPANTCYGAAATTAPTTFSMTGLPASQPATPISIAARNNGLQTSAAGYGSTGGLNIQAALSGTVNQGEYVVCNPTAAAITSGSFNVIMVAQ